MSAERSSPEKNEAQNSEKVSTPFHKILRSSFTMASATMTSRILGLVREQAMALTFGASGVTDAFGVAYRIPNLLRDLLAEGVFSSSFVPIFMEAKLKDPKAARKLLWALFTLLGVITVILSLLMAIFAPTLVALFTGHIIETNQERFDLTVTLVRIMSPFLVMVSLAALFMGVLNSIKIFFVPALAPAFFNVVMIGSIFWLTPVLIQRGVPGILSMGVGVLVGGLAQLVVQLPLVWKNNFSPVAPGQLFTPYVKRVIGRMGFGTVGVAATQINVLITTILATGTIVGAVSWLNYAFRLFQLPVGILSVSLAGSNLVHFSDAWKRGDKEQSVNLLASSYLISWMTIILALTLLSVFSKEVVHLIFERGAFVARDTQMTTVVLRYYLIGLPCYGLYKIFGPTFFVLDKPQVPILISVCSIIFNIIFCLSLVPHYGFSVLALGTSCSMIINASIQAYFVKKYLSLSTSFFINKDILVIFVGGVVSGVVVYRLKLLFFNFADGFIFKCWSLIWVSLIGCAVYICLLSLFGTLKHLRIKKINNFLKS